MLRYKNLSGNAGVTAYEMGEEYIIIRFTDGSIYLYNYTKPGREQVNRMKILAAKGVGLTTFINQYVRDNYAEKLG